MSEFTGSKHSQFLNISSHFEADLDIKTLQPMFKRHTYKGIHFWIYSSAHSLTGTTVTFSQMQTVTITDTAGYNFQIQSKIHYFIWDLKFW